MLTLDKTDHDCGCGGRARVAGERMVETKIACLACGSSSKVRVPAANVLEPIKHDIFKCDECGAHMAFGQLAYREVIEPFTDDKGLRWVRRRFQDPKTKQDVFVLDVDRERALTIARELLALVTL